MTASALISLHRKCLVPAQLAADEVNEEEVQEEANILPEKKRQRYTSVTSMALQLLAVMTLLVSALMMAAAAAALLLAASFASFWKEVYVAAAKLRREAIESRRTR